MIKKYGFKKRKKARIAILLQTTSEVGMSFQNSQDDNTCLFYKAVLSMGIKKAYSCVGISLLRLKSFALQIYKQPCHTTK
jgi:hypothetical protein